MTRTVLVIDDEPDLVRLLDYNLSRADYLVLSAPDGRTGLDMARRHHPDVIVLDVMMSGLDGWEVVKRLRQDPATASLPVLMLTAKAEEPDKVVGLELGADDYLTKPFGMRELHARLKALLRRSETSRVLPDVLKVGPLVIDSARRSTTVGGESVVLTATEFNILHALAARRGRVLTRDDLISLARGDEVAVVERTVDVHVSAIRRKLGSYGDLIETVRGIGYRLKDPAADVS